MYYICIMLLYNVLRYIIKRNY